jgi:hypothetical protein
MTRFNSWVVGRTVAAFDGANMVFDVSSLPRWSQHWVHVLHTGVVVDGPHRLELDLLGRTMNYLDKLAWNGSLEDAKERVLRLRELLAKDPVAAGCLHGAGVSIGFLCTCSSNLLAFRVGRFRVVVDGHVVLWEDSDLRSRDPGVAAAWPVESRRMAANTPVRTLSGDIDDRDFLLLTSADRSKTVELIHARDMEPERIDDPRIVLRGVWL